MLDLHDKTCPICGKTFAVGDDVVVCPHCGAPHHRECWKKNGRCAYASSHGTAEQWRPPLDREDDDVWVCGNCGTVNPTESETCRKCGRAYDEPPLPQPEDQTPPVDPAVFSPPYTPYGEVPSDGVVGGETAMDLATFLGPNAGYYLPRFQYIEQSRNPVSWNWAAALFPVEWLLYRKMEKAFFLAFAVFAVLAIPYVAVFVLGWRAMAADPSALQAFLSGGEIPEGSTPAWLFLLTHIASLLSLALRGALGMRANDLYWRHTKHRMKKAHAGNAGETGFRQTLAQKGGVSPGWVALYIAVLTVATGAVIFLLLWQLL